MITEIHAQVDSAVNEKATAVLEQLGMTVSDALRLLLTRTAEDGVFPLPVEADAIEHDRWFRAQVQQALDDPRPGIPHEEVKERFARLRGNSAGEARDLQVDLEANGCSGCRGHLRLHC